MTGLQPLVLLPDVDDIVRDILLPSGLNIGYETPGAKLLAALPWCTARRIGGEAIHAEKLDRATVIVKNYSTNMRASKLAASTCRSLLYLAWKRQIPAGLISSSGAANATIAHYQELSAPSVFPEPGMPEGVVCITATYSLLIRPIPT